MEENKQFTDFVVDDTHYQTLITRKYQQRKPYQAPNAKQITAFIPGSIRDIFVKEGDSVGKGDKLLVLEAMKMKNVLKAPMDGIIKKVNVKSDERVVKQQILVELS